MSDMEKDVLIVMSFITLIVAMLCATAIVCTYLSN